MVGGRRDDDDYSGATYVYDRVADIWTRMADMPTPRAHLGCGAVDGGREVVAAGGWTDEARSTVEIYNVDTDTWRTGEW